MKRITVAAPAKVNLTLHIPARLENGYHAVEMVMQTVTLFDRVTVEEAQGLHIAADMPLTENEADNTAYRAATLFAFCRIFASPSKSISPCRRDWRAAAPTLPVRWLR